MRRWVLCLLFVAVPLSAVGLSQGPFRRLFFGPTKTSTTRTVTRKTCTDLNRNGICDDEEVTLKASAPVVTEWVVASPPAVVATVTNPAPVADFVDANFVETESSDGLRRELVKASRKAVRSGTITRRDARRVRVALFSPAFREAAEDLCIVQMAFSGDDAADNLPRKANGDIDRVAIDWEGFAAFLERILPLIVDLLIAFGAGS